MRKIVAKIPIILLFLSVAAASFLHFFLYSDSFVNDDGGNATIYVIVLIVISAVLCAIASPGKDSLPTLFDFASKKQITAVMYLLSISFFVDFLHQGYNCYKYLEQHTYTEYNYLICVAASGVFALFCCFYFIVFSKTVTGSNYDVRNFTALHLSPVIWALLQLFVIMIKIVDINTDYEIFYQFIFLCVFLCFALSLARAVGNKTGKLSRMFCFSAMLNTAMSVIIVLPRWAAFINSGGKAEFTMDYSGVTYFMLGVFSFVLLRDINKRRD
ncbi:MAG: hypothetical protein LIO62_02715 [Clostridiales bacterium]|nr:hypothetical protein [Clostridiales bacterium]